MKAPVVSMLVVNLLAMLLCSFGSCRDAEPKPPKLAPPPSSPAASAKAEREDRIAGLEKAVDEAAARHDEVARLTAKVQLSEERTKVAEAQVSDLRRETKQDKADLAAAVEKARLDKWRERLYWFAGVLGLLALGAVVVAIFQPEVARWAVRFAVACAAVAALAVFVSRLLPYLVWIGGGLALAGVAGYLLWNKLSDKTRRQVIGAVDRYKAEIPDYRRKFGEAIDDDADRLVDRTREHLGLKAGG